MSLSRFSLCSIVWCLTVLLVACSPGTSSTTPTPASPSPSTQTSPTATTLPSGTLLYQADWSHGLSGWQGTHGWKVVQGQLETDSNDLATITIPYRPPVTNYTLEVRIQIVRLLQNNGGYFTIFATRAPGKDGYQAGVSDLKGSAPRPNGSHPQAQVLIDPSSSMSSASAPPIDYEPGSQWHIYRVEVRDNQALLLADGVQIGRASSEQTAVLSNGPIGLSSELLVLRVSSFRVTAL